MESKSAGLATVTRRLSNPSPEKTRLRCSRPQRLSPFNAAAPRHSPAVVDWATWNVAAKPLLLGRHWPLHLGPQGTSRSPPQVVFQACSTTGLAWCIAEYKPWQNFPVLFPLATGLPATSCLPEGALQPPKLLLQIPWPPFTHGR